MSAAARKVAINQLVLQGVDREWAEEHVKEAKFEGRMLYYEVDGMTAPPKRYFGEFVIPNPMDEAANG